MRQTVQVFMLPRACAHSRVSRDERYATCYVGNEETELPYVAYSEWIGNRTDKRAALSTG